MAANLLNDAAEYNAEYEDDWTEIVTLQLTLRPKLGAQKRVSLLFDYHGEDDVIELNVRCTLIGYAVQHLSVDTTSDHSMNSNAYQLFVMNRDKIEPFAVWAFH